VSIYAQEEGPPNALQFPVVTDRLSNRKNVPLVESRLCSRSTMAGRTKQDALSRVARIWAQFVVGRQESWNIHQDRGISRLPGSGVNLHLAPRRRTSKESHLIEVQP
jgi:hypothetical protein